MDQNTIIEALQKALDKGSGNLDDLENLLKRAQQDIQKAKDEEKARQEAAAKKRGEEIAALANRLLNDKITDDDAAAVLNTWLRGRGVQGKGLTGKDLAEIFDNADEKINKVNEDLAAAWKDLENSVKAFCDGLNVDKNKKCNCKKDPDPNKVIDDFLKSFGLR